jgi:NACHT domain
MNDFIKRTVIPLSGYVYQNLVGLGLLCDWLDDPSLYQWVKFEADNGQIAQGLDDIVALSRDDSFTLLQVKFTVNSDDPSNALSWKWLLNHKPNGRSNLQKWADALFSLTPSRVNQAALITNRRPDREFETHIDSASRRVRFDELPPAVRDVIFKQLGTEKAGDFFSTFEFHHSFQGFIALERTLIDRFIPRHTDRHGWLALFRQAIDWAVRKGFPRPYGRISLDILRGTIDQRRPEPLKQSFRIPAGYHPPDENFAKQFIDDIVASKSSTVVLWGSPGQGKSTFISYTCEALVSRSVPYIRHHYFLDLQDQSDRFTLDRVANSFMAQMEQQHVEHVQGLKNGAEHLREWIINCAEGYKRSGKQFVVVVDGLDHVWRENDQNKGPLDSLFATLLPVPDNVILLIGTQKVSTEQLPKHFERFVPVNEWIQLPRMSLVSIKGWLATLHKSKRFELTEKTGREANDPIADLAVAFERVSSGHPLVLTYSFEALAREHRTLTVDLVSENVPLLNGDVTDYYRSLWQRLSFDAKDALHLAADTGFIWPILGLEACLNVAVGELHREISHLFYQTDAGQVPFHGSLYVFVRTDNEHAGRITDLLPSIIEWLEKKAPPFHCWGWLWLYKARVGDPSYLLTLPDRRWLIRSLANAYPKEQIENILEASERTAFDSGDYATAIRQRWLKIRLLNGPEFQLDDYKRLYQCALHLTEDDYPLKLLASEIYIASVQDLYFLGMQYLGSGKLEEAKECQWRIRERINDRLHAHAYDTRSLQADSEHYLELVAGTKGFEPKGLANSIRGLMGSSSPKLFALFLRALSKHEDLSLLMAFLPVPMLLGMRRELELACIRLSGLVSARLHEWPDFVRFRKHPISSCWVVLYIRERYRPSNFDVYRPELNVEQHAADKDLTEEYLHTLFFFAVARCVNSGGVPNIVEAPQYEKRAWLTSATKQVLNLANAVGGLLARGELPAFALPYKLTGSLEIPKDHDTYTDYISFRKALMTIAADLFLLCRLRSGVTTIPTTEWTRATKSQHFNMQQWREQYLTTGFKIVDDELIELDIKKSQRQVVSSINRLNERTEGYLDLCELAIQYQLKQFARELLSQALSCVIGYGWRKDPTMSYVVNCIESMIPIDLIFARQMVCRIAPIINRIGDMTEDDGIRESELATSLLQLMPSSYVSYYKHWLKISEWYTAEQVFSQLLAAQDLGEPIMRFVTCAVWGAQEVKELRVRAESGDARATEIIDENARRFGQRSNDLGKERYPSSNQYDKAIILDVINYPPGSLNSLLTELNAQHAYIAERRIIREWFEHWRSQKRGIEILQELKLFLESERIPSGISEVLDMAFSLSLELEGAKKAYRWLVVAQIARHGWEPYYGIDDARQRFKLFAVHYRKQWRQFISDTTRSERGGASSQLIIPHDRLVFFLLAVGQQDLAKELVATMVDATVEDFQDLPLDVPSWLETVL